MQFKFNLFYTFGPKTWYMIRFKKKKVFAIFKAIIQSSHCGPVGKESNCSGLST